VVTASVLVTSVDVAIVSVVVAGALVVSAGVDVLVELISELRADNGSPSASAPEAITPSSSNATVATASFPNPNRFLMLVRFSTVVTPLVPQLSRPAACRPMREDRPVGTAALTPS
ncbi:MAG: hypothetical protein QOD52_1677, partial [Gaiellaceae bacterium]|nr:hypothetical protein [Gaiellaceae bacterium]